MQSIMATKKAALIAYKAMSYRLISSMGKRDGLDSASMMCINKLTYLRRWSPCDGQTPR